MKVFEGYRETFFKKFLLSGFGAAPLHALRACFRECLAAKLTAAPLKRTPFSPAESAKLNGQQPSGDSIAGK